MLDQHPTVTVDSSWDVLFAGRALKFLNDEALRDMALGGSYFRLLGLDYRAPGGLPCVNTRAAAGGAP
jgi:hypothetical protein